MTSALQMVQMIQDGNTTSVALVIAAFERIAETDDALKACSHKSKHNKT